MKVSLSFEGDVKEIAALLNEVAERLEKQELDSVNQKLQTLQKLNAKQAMIRSKLNKSEKMPPHQSYKVQNMDEQKQLANKVEELEKKVNALAEGAIQTSAVIAAIEWSLIGKKIVTPDQLKNLYEKNLSFIADVENTPS